MTSRTTTGMEPHRFERDGVGYTATFERVAEGWVARIRRDDGAACVAAFPDHLGYDPDDPRGSLIAGCKAALARLPWPAPTRH